jgi:hypothetical protein
MKEIIEEEKPGIVVIKNPESAGRKGSCRLFYTGPGFVSFG